MSCCCRGVLGLQVSKPVSHVGKIFRACVDISGSKRIIVETTKRCEVFSRQLVLTEPRLTALLGCCDRSLLLLLGCCHVLRLPESCELRLQSTLSTIKLMGCR